jgi:hypothetical protein
MPTSFEDAAARLVEKWTKASKHTTADVLTLGQLTHGAIRARLRGVDDPGARKVARADAVKALRAALADAGCDRASELQRWVGCWAVGDVFGIDAARGLPLATVRAFIPLVRRNAKTETWAARSTFRDFAKELWGNAATMKAKDVTATIRARVGATRKPRTVKAPDAAAAMTKVVKAIDALPELAQRQLLKALHQRFYPAATATPATVPTVPVEGQRQHAPPSPARIDPAHVPAPQHARIDAPAGRVAPSIIAPPEQDKAGFFGSVFGRKAG